MKQRFAAERWGRTTKIGETLEALCRAAGQWRSGAVEERSGGGAKRRRSGAAEENIPFGESPGESRSCCGDVLKKS